MYDLGSVRQKIARANEHYEVFQIERDRFIETKPCAYRQEADVDRGQTLWRVIGEPKMPPPHLVSVIGDSLQNFRSALDHLAWQLVESNGLIKPTRQTAFPIFNNPDVYKRYAPTKLKGMSDGAKTAIKDLQPCFGRNAHRNFTLWNLENLNNVDKHRHLNVVAAATAGGSWDGIKGDVFLHDGPLEDGTVVARYGAENVNVYFGLVLDVAFRDAEPPGGIDSLVSAILVGCDHLIGSVIVPAFERDFLS